jgi:hypothetical protein
VFTHRHDRHQTSVSKAVARVIEVRWLMKKFNNYYYYNYYYYYRHPSHTSQPSRRGGTQTRSKSSQRSPSTRAVALLRAVWLTSSTHAPGEPILARPPPHPLPVHQGAARRVLYVGSCTCSSVGEHLRCAASPQPPPVTSKPLLWHTFGHIGTWARYIRSERGS